MEFGWINLFGGIIVVLILIPNIVYALKQRGHDAGKSVPKALGVCEQIGRYACMILMWLPLLVWKFGFGSSVEFVLYLLLNGVLIFAYYLGWLRYFKKPGQKTAMALAILPTLVFLTSGLLLHHWLLVAAAIVFGISHGMITYITHAGNRRTGHNAVSFDMTPEDEGR